MISNLQVEKTHRERVDLTSKEGVPAVLSGRRLELPTCVVNRVLVKMRLNLRIFSGLDPAF